MAEDTGQGPIAEAQSEVAVFNRSRLPYASVLKERFDIDRAGWTVLTEAIWPNAQSVNSIAMALAYCRSRGLDPFKKVVHIVPMWNTALRKMVETVWPGIAELRTTAHRTGQYAGCDATEFGPDIETGFSDGSKLTHPAWARLTVYKNMGGTRVPFVGPKTKWLESYATARNDSDVPNSMWRDRAEGQLEKVAEAGALRRAFPEEIGNDYAAEEMEGRTISTPSTFTEATKGDTSVPRIEAPKKMDGPPKAPPANGAGHPVVSVGTPAVVEEAEVVSDDPRGSGGPATPDAGVPGSTGPHPALPPGVNVNSGLVTDYAAFSAWVQEELLAVPDTSEIWDVWERLVEPWRAKMPPDWFSQIIALRKQVVDGLLEGEADSETTDG